MVEVEVKEEEDVGVVVVGVIEVGGEEVVVVLDWEP